MRVMVMVRATAASEAGQLPSTELLEAMNTYNEELQAAGILLAGEGLLPSSEGAGALHGLRADREHGPLPPC